MDSARDTVVQLGVELWKGVALVDGCYRDITNSSSLDDIPVEETAREKQFIIMNIYLDNIMSHHLGSEIAEKSNIHSVV